MSLAPKISSQVKTCESNEKRRYKERIFQVENSGLLEKDLKVKKENHKIIIEKT